jgi:hypothetical protein
VGWVVKIEVSEENMAMEVLILELTLFSSDCTVFAERGVFSFACSTLQVVMQAPLPVSALRLLQGV